MNLLYFILVMSFTGSLVFLLFKVIEQLSKHYFSATWHYNILKCIVLFFCIPIGKVISFIASYKMFGSEADQSLGFITDYAGKVSKYTTAQNSVNYFIMGIWLMGMVVILLRQMICYIRFRCIVSYNRVPANAMLQWVAKTCAEKQGIKKPVRLYVNEFINTPMLIGFFSPIVLLPCDNLELTNAEYIISHELTHYKKKDLIIKFIVLVIRSVHWFNPVAYFMSVNLEKWCEYACDERNAINLTMEMKKKYGLAILDTAAIVPIYGANYGTPFLLPKQNLKERLVFMLNVKKMNRKSILFAFVLSVMLIICGFLTGIAGEIGNQEIPNGNKTIIYNKIKINSAENNIHTKPSDQDKLDQLN